jgi:hypothetical protein
MVFWLDLNWCPLVMFANKPILAFSSFFSTKKWWRRSRRGGTSQVSQTQLYTSTAPTISNIPNKGDF